MRLILAATAALSIASPSLAHISEPDAHPGHHADAPAQATVEGVGQIKSVDAKGGAITLHHGPINALGWPAMTMSFKASPELLQAAKAGETVKFTLKTPENEVIAFQPQ